jgi:hypothetical protein
MTQASESSLGLAPEGSGPDIRTITVEKVIAGVVSSVRMQVIAVSDAEGRLLRADDDRWDELLTGQAKTNELLEALLEALT